MQTKNLNQQPLKFLIYFVILKVKRKHGWITVEYSHFSISFESLGC